MTPTHTPATPIAEPSWRVRLIQALTADRLLAVASLVWLALIASVPVEQHFALAGTQGLLIVGLSVGLSILIRAKRVALLLALTQLALFTALHSQVYAAGGQQHYVCDREPGVLDWAQFTAAHVVRAADVLDFVEEFGIDLQAVKHGSTLPGVLLVVMHLSVDIFLLALLIRLVLGLGRWLASRREASSQQDVFERKASAERLGRVLDLAGKICLLVCLLLIFGSAYVQGWRGSDWLLWPLDAVLRVVDFADAMHIFHWQLHGVAPSYWLSALAVSLRLFAGVYIAEWVNYAQLKVLGHRALRTVEEFASDLSSRHAEVRRAAAAALGRISAEARVAVPELARTLADQADEVRRVAAEALGRIGPEARGAVPDLARALADKNREVRRAAAEALGSIGAEAVVPDLVRALANQGDEVRRAVAEALGRIGTEARGAVPDLARALEDPVAEVRRAAAEVLGKIDPAWVRSIGAEAVVPGLVRALADPVAEVRRAVAAALGKFGAEAQGAVPALARALVDPVAEVRRAAALALGRIGAEARGAVLDLARALADKNRDVRRTAAEALGSIGAETIVPDLVRALGDQNQDVRRAAAEAIEGIGPPAVPNLRQALLNPNKNVRKAAALILERIAPQKPD